MKFSALRFLLPVLALAFVAPSAALAQKGAGSGPTVIPGGSVSATYVITKSGSYVLGADRVMTDPTKPVIEVAAPDVTIDLAGFGLQRPAPAASGGVGILITAPENVEIRNGTIASSFTGVETADGKGVRLLHLRVIGGKFGILAAAASAWVENCHVLDTTTAGVRLGHRSLIRNSVIFPQQGTGLELSGLRNRVIGCDIQLDRSLWKMGSPSHVGISSTSNTNIVVDTVVRAMEPVGMVLSLGGNQFSVEQ